MAFFLFQPKNALKYVVELSILNHEKEQRCLIIHQEAFISIM